MLMNFILILIMMFLSLAYFTIMERKLLGSFHIRLGPSKVGLLGIFQPFSDVIKLFSKNINLYSKINMFMWNISPLITFLIFILFLNFFPIKNNNNFMMMNIIMIIFLLGLPTFTFFWSSFFSFSKFSLISSKRCISQMLSYEMGLVLIMIFLIPFIMKMNLQEVMTEMKKCKILHFFISVITLILILGESSRIPFDFIESESELVSGFNTEFSSSYFSLFFVYEYGMMLYFSLFFSMIFMKSIMFFPIYIFLFIHIRSSFPRFRYDQMMMFLWKNFLMMLILILFTMKVF